MTTLSCLRSFSSGRRRCARANEHAGNSRTTQDNCTPNSEGLDGTKASHLPVRGRKMSLDIPFHRTPYPATPGLLVVSRFTNSNPDSLPARIDVGPSYCAVDTPSQPVRHSSFPENFSNGIVMLIVDVCMKFFVLH